MNSRTFHIPSCDCDSWLAYVGDLKTYLEHAPNNGFGKMFEFCPWCGKTLKVTTMNQVVVGKDKNVWENNTY